MDTQMLIGSRFEAGTGDQEQVLNPRTGKLIEGIPEASTVAGRCGGQRRREGLRDLVAHDAGAALGLSPQDRRCHRDGRATAFAALEALNCGKPINAVTQRRNPGDRRLLAVLRGRGADHARRRSRASICRATPR